MKEKILLSNFEVGDQFKVLSYDEIVKKFGEPVIAKDEGWDDSWKIYIQKRYVGRIYSTDSIIGRTVIISNIWGNNHMTLEIKTESGILFIRADLEYMKKYLRSGVMWKIDVTKAIQTLLNY